MPRFDPSLFVYYENYLIGRKENVQSRSLPLYLREIATASDKEEYLTIQGGFRLIKL